jgi:ATP-dependent helicase Lhr and Lhr-like helicase
MSADDSLDLFHPLIRHWFLSQVGTPTDVQVQAWPRIAAGEHVLLTAPTGTGKTLAAFLWALNQFIVGEYETGHCRVLYVSPLKALNNDIQRNLLTPLAALREVFEEHGESFPDIRVQTRSGDTPADERRRMLRTPPEILITTPESLNLMLSSRGGLGMLNGIQVVILDEIHSIVAGKRGTHLITAVERLVRLCGEFQRISLSATVRPMEVVAEFVGGYELLEDNRYRLRPVALVRADSQKTYQVQVRFPAVSEALPVWEAIAEDCRKTIARNRSTLIFTNMRRLAETLTWRINTPDENSTEMQLLAYAHHGALAREIRTEVERRLKSGRLRAIVATSSLEMGIDIGSLDEVVLVQSPPGIASAIQRVGRAGHKVGEVSRATILPTHGQDILTAAVLARNILAQNIEAVHPIRAPLDVLAQMLISMSGVETWNIDDLFSEVRRSWAFHEISREQFDLVLNMLEGRYAQTRLRELKPKLSIDRVDNTAVARPGALQDVYFSGGTIPDRGMYHLRHLETNALIGELDEEYVWEADVGHALTFGTQNWRIERITHNDVFVLPAGAMSANAPFYRSEAMDRDWHFSEQIGNFLESANERLDDPTFKAELQRDYCLDGTTAQTLRDYLKHQKESCDRDLPHRHHVLIEHIQTGPEGTPGTQVVIHTGWGGKVNRPLALALSAAWEEQYGERVEIYAGDDAVYLLMIEEINSADLLSLVSSARVDELLTKRLEGSGFFGARFRECAGRALLLTRRKMRERMPLWVSRLRSKQLLESIANFPDFPILLEAWRSCLQDEFDMEALRGLLRELEVGVISWSEVHHHNASPFAAALSWEQVNKYMYEDDTPKGELSSKLRQDLLREVAMTPSLRPVLPPEVVAGFVAKRQRLAPEYAPQSARDLLDWVKERLLLPMSEWRQLLEAITRDHGLAEEELLSANLRKLAKLSLVDAVEPLIAAVEQLPRIMALWDNEVIVESLSGEPIKPPRKATDHDSEVQISDLLGEWLRCYGPVNPQWITQTLGISESALLPEIEDLLDLQKLVQGRLVAEGAEDDLCDSENYEILLRLARTAAIPSFTPLPCEKVPLFLAHFQGLCKPGDDADALWERMAQLSGSVFPAELWEEAILPARLARYDSSWLDSLMQEGRLHWIGMGKGKIAFCLEDDLPLVHIAPHATPADNLRDLLPDEYASYGLQALAMRTSKRLGDLTLRLWEGVWHGLVSNDSAAALRKGIISKYQPPNLPQPTVQGHPEGRRLSRKPLERWIGSGLFAGNWYRLPEATPTDDLLEEEERAKDRVRLLLDRYGLLFRELLQNEAPMFQWPRVFRALRLMELSGEVLSGIFFHGIQGLQFISPRAFRMIQRDLPEDAVWWVNAYDPAAPSGLALDALKGSFPRRVPTNFLVFRGQDLVLTLLREGKELNFSVPPEDARLQEYLAPLQVIITRRFQPVMQVVIDKINGVEVNHSPYVKVLEQNFNVAKDGKKLFVSRKLR